MMLSIMGMVARDPNGGCCHRWQVYCFGCGRTYVTSGNRTKIARRKGCQSCAHKGNRNGAKKS